MKKKIQLYHHQKTAEKTNIDKLPYMKGISYKIIKELILKRV